MDWVASGHVDAFSPVHGEDMDVRGRATQERLPNVPSKSPASAHVLAGFIGKRQVGPPLFTPGMALGHPVLPYALRASFAVRAAPAAQWATFLWRFRERWIARRRRVKALHSNSMERKQKLSCEHPPLTSILSPRGRGRLHGLGGLGPCRR